MVRYAMSNPARKHPKWAAWRRDYNRVLLKLACRIDDNSELVTAEKQQTENPNFFIPIRQSTKVELQVANQLHVMLAAP